MVVEHTLLGCALNGETVLIGKNVHQRSSHALRPEACQTKTGTV